MPDNKPKISNKKTPKTSPGIFSGEVSLDVFLSDYWQKKPLLIRNAFPNLPNPVAPEELAGMACEEGINARLIIEKDDVEPWSVQHGPFDEDDFSHLPETHWTLLVNDVEKYIPEAKTLFDQFRFIADWRKDDMMISYAVDGGSVGPHLDAYDVFLIQTYGQRNWKISYQHCNQFIKDIDLKILAEFNPDEDWLLNPGDMLYLPPNLAHYGVAKGPCMTASVGFRAPSVRAMTSEFAEFIANQTATTLRYTDPNIQLQNHPSEISTSALNTVKNLLNQKLIFDDSMLKQWFGEYITDTRSSNQLSETNRNIINFETLKKRLKTQEDIHQSPFSRFLFTRDKDTALLFVDGQSYPTSINFSECLCQNHTIMTTALFAACSTYLDENALLDLYNRGCID
ncbi:MAG: cupin domain-containing protein [Gammaproteobacteria bacterium]|nr:cupin domain-containing protein [Gammaproteobacteria bacterium]